MKIDDRFLSQRSSQRSRGIQLLCSFPRSVAAWKPELINSGLSYNRSEPRFAVAKSGIGFEALQRNSWAFFTKIRWHYVNYK